MGDEHQNPQTYPSNRMHLPVNDRVDCYLPGDVYG